MKPLTTTDNPLSPLTWSLCFAERDSSSIIDLCHPLTKRSQCYGETLEAIRTRYPSAEIMPFTEWADAKAASQDSPITWEPTTAEHFEDMMNIIPPAAWHGADFLIGEPCDHHAKTGAPRFQAMRKAGEHYLASSRPITVAEFKKI